MRLRVAPQDERGAAAVEFALIAGVLAMLIFGMLQFGIAFFETQTLRAATREGARIGAVGASVSEIQQRVHDASLGVVPNGEVQVAPCPATEPDTDDFVNVSIDIGSTSSGHLQNVFSLDIPFMPTINLTPTIEGEFRCERPSS